MKDIFCKYQERFKNSVEISNTTDRPNIILLIGDDQGYPYFELMGYNMRKVTLLIEVNY